MKKTTLCYLTNGENVLLLFRNKKQNDENEGKWIGIGGKIEDGETPEEASKREILEETGITEFRQKLCGEILFDSDIFKEHMFLFVGSTSQLQTIDCNEGTLKWVSKKELKNLPMWEGDKLFLSVLEENEPYFKMELYYTGEKLIKAVKNGKTLSF